jgi:hypothetical protein
MAKSFIVYGFDVVTKASWDLSIHDERQHAEDAAIALNALVRSHQTSYCVEPGERERQRATRSALNWAGDTQHRGSDLEAVQYGVRSSAESRKLILVNAGGNHFNNRGLFFTFAAAKAFANDTLGSNHRFIGCAGPVWTSPRHRGCDFIWHRGTTGGSRHAIFEWLDAPRSPPMIWAGPLFLVTMSTDGEGGYYDVAVFTTVRAALAYARGHVGDRGLDVGPIGGSYRQGIQMHIEGRRARVEPIDPPRDGRHAAPWARSIGSALAGALADRAPSSQGEWQRAFNGV